MTQGASADVHGQLAHVTGAGSAIGTAICLALARAGADIAMAGRSLQTLEPLLASVSALGRRALAICCDVTLQQQANCAIAAVGQGLGRHPDILINAAGGTGNVSAPVWSIDSQEFASILGTNLAGSFHMMAAVLPPMIERRSGRIVNIGGSFGLRGKSNRAAYSAAKWGLRGLTKSAALDAAAFGVTVNCVCPGVIEGPQFDKVSQEFAESAGMSEAQARVQMANAYPLRRISNADDVAAAVVFLCGSGARQITGQDLAVDAGWTI